MSWRLLARLRSSSRDGARASRASKHPIHPLPQISISSGCYLEACDRFCLLCSLCLFLTSTMNVHEPRKPSHSQHHAYSYFFQIVEWAFGKRMTPQERLRKHQRALEKTQRELDRERVKLENQEKKLVQDIKKSAKNGQMGACKIQAKDLVRTRRYVCVACKRRLDAGFATS